jgi:hypothetical protein
VASEGLNPDPLSAFRQLPGLRILSAIRLAFDIRKVIVAAAGLVLLQLGWSILDWMLPASADATPELSWTSGVVGLRPTGLHWAESSGRLATERLLEPLRLLVSPLLALVEPGASWGRMLHGLLGLLWLVAIWGICGGAIARIALLQIAKQQQMAIADAFRFAVRSAGPLCLAPLCPLLGLGFCALISAGFGALYRVPVLGPPLGGTLLVVPLLLGLIMAMLAAGLVAAWPLMHAAVAAGADDALDALSRSFSYVSQRLGALAVLLLPIALQGFVGFVLVELLASVVVQLTAWSLALTAPLDLINPLFSGDGTAGGTIAAVVHTLWLSVVRLLAHAWVYSFTWSAAALLYLWLRNAVDFTPWTEIDLPSARSINTSNPLQPSVIPEAEASAQSSDAD